MPDYAYSYGNILLAYGNKLVGVSLPDWVAPTVTTSAITIVSDTSATGGGNVTSDGGATVTNRGVCWSTSLNPTISNPSVGAGSGTGAFTALISGLTSNTLYHVRAFACNVAGLSYGSDETFTTDTIPTVTTSSPVTNIAYTSASCGGNVTSDGGATVTARGICWDTTSNPTPGTADGSTSNGSGTGVFYSNLTGLNASTHYYVRAWALNNVGIAYGSNVEFNTTAITVPTVTTSSITNIYQTEASGGGNVTSANGGTVSARGIVWKTSSDPTVPTDASTTNGSGTGSFTSALTGLNPSTHYYVRAWAKNEAGIGYGSNVQFDTSISTLLNSLVGYWKLDESTGSTLYDVLSLTNFTTHGNPSIGYSGKINKGVNFAPLDSGATTETVSYVTPNGDQYTVSCWVKLDALPYTVGRDFYLIKQHINSSPWLTVSIRLLSDAWGANQAYWRLAGPNFNIGVSTDTDLSLNNIGQWYHIVGVANGHGTYPAIYINDVSYIYPWEGTQDGSLYPTGWGVEFGNDYEGAEMNLIGTLDEVGFWRRALTESEITQLYNGGSGLSYPFGSSTTSYDASLRQNIVAYWKFDETTGTTAYDSLSNTNLNIDYNPSIGATGKINTAFNFYNSSTAILHSDSISYVQPDSDKYSISFWMYPNQLASYYDDDRYIFLAGLDFSPWISIDIRFVDPQDTLLFRFAGPSMDSSGSLYAYSSLPADASFKTNQWYHIVCVAEGNGKNPTIYVNNSSTYNYISNGPQVGNIYQFNSTYNFNIGNSYPLSTDSFPGIIDEFAIWRRALTATDVSFLYNNGSGRAYPFT